MTRTGGIIGATALALASTAPARAEEGGTPAFLCLFSTACDGAEGCRPETFTVQIGLADHGDGLWLTYPGRERAADDVTPSDTPMMMFLSPGYDDNLAITVFPTGEAIHVEQDYQPGLGPRQVTAFGQCEVM